MIDTDPTELEEAATALERHEAHDPLSFDPNCPRCDAIAESQQEGYDR